MSCSLYGSDATHEYYTPSSPPDHAYTPTGLEEDFQIEYPPHAYDERGHAQSRTFPSEHVDDYPGYDVDELNERPLWSPQHYGHMKDEPHDGYYHDNMGSFEYSLDKDCIYGRDIDKKRRQQEFGSRKSESYEYSLDDDRPYNQSLDEENYAYNSERDDCYEDQLDKDGSRRDRCDVTENRCYDYDLDDKQQLYNRKSLDITDPYDLDHRSTYDLSTGLYKDNDSLTGHHEYNGAVESRGGYDSSYEYSTEKECGGGGVSWSDQRKDSELLESETGYWFLLLGSLPVTP